MASPAVVAPHVNGVAALSRPDSPASSINSSSTKRKREDNDDDDNENDSGEPTINTNNGADSPKPQANGRYISHDNPSLIRDFFVVLQSLDSKTPSVLERPLPEDLPDGEPSSKRAKSEESSQPLSIANKVTQDDYKTLHDLVADVVQAANAQIKELEAAAPPRDNDALAKTASLKSTALELYRQELAYPNLPRSGSRRNALGQGQSQDASGLVLATVGAAPTLKPLFTSLRRDTAPRSALDVPLPRGVALTRVLSETPAASEKSGRSLTLGELFPSPRNLPPLQPPKAPKTTTKSNVLTFYHPELTEKSKYRSGTYYSQHISAGLWLDYSNATPTIHAKTKQRERAQSLAGHKPSTVELEMSEMEALFRGAFSNFAPCKDDSGAIVPSTQVSRMWWQRVGRRNLAKMADAEEPEEDIEDGTAAGSSVPMEIDEERVKDAIENWDDSAIDPSLDDALGKKSDHDKEVDDLLEEVSDLIGTLASYQRNRNLTLPTSQDRYSADPVNGDMLRNGNLSHQPSEEEQMTYEALKAQLSLIIQTLPPYAVARLNSDKLAELAVSTKIEIRSDEYRGVMEDDEPSRLARLAAQAAATSNQRQAQRTPSVSGPYAHQYQGQFTPSVRPVGTAQHFPQTPVRQGANMYPRAPSSVPVPQPHHQVQPRPAPQTQFRPQMYAPQLAKAQGPYGHSNMPQQYVASPSQQRLQQQHPNFNVGQAGTPTPRYPQGYPANYQQHQQILPQHGQPSPLPQHSPHPQPVAPHQQQHHPQQPPYSPYTNGGGQMPRTISPQMPQAHAYSQSPTPPQQHQQMVPRPPPYGSPAPGGMPPNAVARPYGAGSPGPGMVPQPPPPGGAAAAGATGQSAGAGAGGPGGNNNSSNNRPPSAASNLTGFATVMPEVQQRQVMEQARARADAEQRAQGHMGKVTQGQGQTPQTQTQPQGTGGQGQVQQGQQGQTQTPTQATPGEVVGLAGIGLAGHMDVHKVAAAKLAMQQQQQQQQQGQGGGAGRSGSVSSAGSVGKTAAAAGVNGASAGAGAGVAAAAAAAASPAGASQS